MSLNNNQILRVLRTGLLCGALVWVPCAAAQTTASAAGLAYIGTLDKKLLIYDENKEEVVGEIQLQGVPRTTALSKDQSKLVILTAELAVEVVDLKARKMLTHFTLTDEKSKPRMARGGLAIDPTGHYLYSVMRASVRETDYYRMEPAQFVKVDLTTGKIVKSFPFPADQDQGFASGATYKVSPDGKLLYVFGEEVDVYDLDTFKHVDSIPMGVPEYPGDSPYRLTPQEDPNARDNVFTSLFTTVDPVVHKGTIGIATIDLNTRKSSFAPIGKAVPSLGFMISPDHKRGYSIMFNGAVGGNRETEFWVWDLDKHEVIKKAPFESRPTLRFGLSGDGKKIYLYGAGSSFEVFDGETLKSRKLIFLNKDTTTNLITLAAK